MRDLRIVFWGDCCGLAHAQNTGHSIHNTDCEAFVAAVDKVVTEVQTATADAAL
jgi:hypothetical protein